MIACETRTVAYERMAAYENSFPPDRLSVDHAAGHLALDAELSSASTTDSFPATNVAAGGTLGEIARSQACETELSCHSPSTS